MKASDTHNSRITGILPVPATGEDIRGACRLSLTISCLVCLLLCLLTSSAIADSSSAPPDPNSPSILAHPHAQPTDTPADANRPTKTAQNAELQPKRPPEPTTDTGTLESSSPQDLTEPKGADWLIAKAPKTDLARGLWRDRMTVPKNLKENKTKEQLQQLIKRIRTIEFKPPEPVHKPVVTVTPISQIEPNLTAVELPDQNLIDVQQTQKTATKPQLGTVSNETLNILTERLQQPELLKNPFELGEILSNAGYLKEAALCYNQALARIDPNLPDPTGRKSWILFQIGNCLRKDNPPKALEAYSQLINEHAGSLWTDLAKARSSLINWYQQDKPKMLIEESRPKPADNTGPADFIITTQSQTKTE